jgi:hypothetical protein
MAFTHPTHLVSAFLGFKLGAIGLLAVFATAALANAEPIDEAAAQSQGIRKLAGRHLTLYTDLPAEPEIDRLPAVFDQAVPQWAEYFGVDPAKVANWQARAYLIGERRRFDALGLMPAGNDQFVNGISIGSELWLYDQPTAYYRRHLLLHEGTHLFMAAFLGGCGPGWYMEGTAELMATHRLDERTGRLALRIMPQRRSEVPMLGRIKLIRDAVAAGRTMAFPAVMQVDNRQQLGNEAYAWTWAAAKFLDAHPRYSARFRALKTQVLSPAFNALVRDKYEADWGDLSIEWEAFIATLDHGYDFERMVIDFTRGQPLGGRAKTATVQAERGWQSSGVWLEAGNSYRITARGRYEIASEQKDGALQPWPCEPGGVTIEYHDGRPLGMLLGAVVGEESPASAQARFVAPIEIGLQTTIEPDTNGTLYLRVNDSASRLHDNRGMLSVTIEEAR